jgi:tight adherence protein C
LTYWPWFVFIVCAIAMVWLLIPRRSLQESAAGEDGSQGVPDTSSARSVAGSGSAPSGKVTLRERLVHAGFYREGFLAMLRVARVLLLLGMIGCGYLLSLSGAVSREVGLTLGVLGSGFAALAPSFLLDFLKSRRQLAMRRALPDALDVIIVALEGGLPVAASFRRVASELAGVHPLLAVELTIVQREVQMGRSLGEAMQNLASRFDLDDLRSMARVIQQSERYGSSVTRAFRIFADGLRANRIHQAEEMARKASVKLIFPTVLFIFPVMFVVILAPAVIQLSSMLESYGAKATLP